MNTRIIWISRLSFDAIRTTLPSASSPVPSPGSRLRSWLTYWLTSLLGTNESKEFDSNFYWSSKKSLWFDQKKRFLILMPKLNNLYPHAIGWMPFALDCRAPELTLFLHHLRLGFRDVSLTPRTLLGFGIWSAFVLTDIWFGRRTNLSFRVYANHKSNCERHESQQWAHNLYQKHHYFGGFFDPTLMGFPSQKRIKYSAQSFGQFSIESKTRV